MLMHYGISPPLMLAGFLGATVNIFDSGKATPRDVAGTVFIGTWVSNYFGFILESYSNETVGLAGAFLLGFGEISFLVYVLERKLPPTIFHKEDKDGA